MSEHDPSAWLASIAEIFDDLGVDWTVVGALAANRYRATPRFTTDLDTMARHHPALVDTLRAGYEVSVFADEGELPHLIRCHRGPEAIDVLLPVVEYQAVALARAVDHVLAVEDVIVHKGRQGGRGPTERAGCAGGTLSPAVIQAILAV